ncbi:MAG: family 14 glycosylhydrolase [Chloroflexi bacterium]|nr:family 14 glycosylhydrolase [Chloroflexota bacterium]MBK8931163.1 family 14 glycosylhydrolase [Chloroflexota bacterium]
MQKRLLALVLGMVWLVGCGTAVAQPPAPTPSPSPTPLPTALMGREPVVPLFDSPSYGIHISQWWQLDALDRDLKLAQDMGFGWIKQSFSWRDIEGYGKNQFDWFRPDVIVDSVENAGLKLIVRIDRQPLWSVRSLPDEKITPNQPPVDYQDFADFCGVLATRYKGRIAAYQVWNEPNLSREWGNESPDPAAYTELLRVCYQAIKAADPEAIVISAGLAPTGTQPPAAMPDTDFLQGMYNAGASNYFDVLGLHAPGFKAPPELSADEVAASYEYGQGRWFAFRHVEDMRAIMVANGDGAKQVAIMEMGWILNQDLHPDYTWHGVTEAEQADYLVRAYQYAQENWQPWIGLMTTIYMADATWTAEANEQWWWSIVLPDGTPRLAYGALKAMPK